MMMAEKNRFSKPVAFNRTNEIDQMILKHVKRRNFSGYVKKLILQDIKAKEQSKGNTETSEESPMEIREKELTVAERLEQLKKAGSPARLPNKDIN
jgi:hypothetical protein